MSSLIGNRDPYIRVWSQKKIKNMAQATKILGSTRPSMIYYKNKKELKLSVGDILFNTEILNAKTSRPMTMLSWNWRIVFLGRWEGFFSPKLTPNKAYLRRITQKNYKSMVILLKRMVFPIMTLLIMTVLPSEYFNMDLKDKKELKR